MSDLLSENEIDALMNGVADRPGGQPGGIDESDYQLYDLTSGMHRVQGWTQYVEIVDDRIKTGLGSRFLGLLHKSVEIKRSDIKIAKYEDYASTLSLPTAINCFSLSGVIGISAIVLDSDLVSALVNVFFGGGNRPTPISGREFSHTEQRLINMIVGTIAEVIQESFKDFTDSEITMVDTEMNPAHFSVYTDTDVLMIRPFHIEFSGMGGMIQLIMPASVVDSLFKQKKSRLASLGISSASALSTMAREFIVDVTGELKGANLTLKEVLELSDGDVLPIEAPDRMDLKVNGVPKFKVRMGEVNGRIGLEIQHHGRRGGGSR